MVLEIRYIVYTTFKIYSLLLTIWRKSSLCSIVILIFFPLTVSKLFCHHDYAHNRIHDADDMKEKDYDLELFPISHTFQSDIFYVLCDKWTKFQWNTINKMALILARMTGPQAHILGTLGIIHQHQRKSYGELAQILSLGHRQRTSTDSTEPISISNLIILLKQQYVD